MSSKCSPAQVVRACFAEVAKAVAHEHRLGLLERLAQGERSVDALAEIDGLSVANASQHLQQLKRVGLLLNRRDGKRIIYRLANEREVVAFMSSLRHLADRAHAGFERIPWIVFRRSRRVGTGNAEATHQPIANGEGHAPRCEAKRRIRQGTHSQCSQYPAGRTRAAVERAATQSPDCGLLSRPLLRLVV